MTPPIVAVVDCDGPNQPYVAISPCALARLLQIALRPRGLTEGDLRLIRRLDACLVVLGSAAIPLTPPAPERS